MEIQLTSHIKMKTNPDFKCHKRGKVNGVFFNFLLFVNENVLSPYQASIQGRTTPDIRNNAESTLNQ